MRRTCESCWLQGLQNNSAAIRKNIRDVSELMHRLIEMSHGLQQTLIDEAINEHLQPCVCASGSGQVLFWEVSASLALASGRWIAVVLAALLSRADIWFRSFVLYTSWSLSFDQSLKDTALSAFCSVYIAQKFKSVRTVIIFLWHLSVSIYGRHVIGQAIIFLPCGFFFLFLLFFLA